MAISALVAVIIPDTKKYISAIDNLLVALDFVIASAKANRKPRKSKPKSAQKLVEKLKYCKADEKFKVASISPEYNSEDDFIIEKDGGNRISPKSKLIEKKVIKGIFLENTARINWHGIKRWILNLLRASIKHLILRFSTCSPACNDIKRTIIGRQ